MRDEKEYCEETTNTTNCHVGTRAARRPDVNGMKLFEKLEAILGCHCGETGCNEGAVETLNRIIAERDDARNRLLLIREEVARLCE